MERRLPLMPLVLNTARIFLLVSLAYHSLMMLRKGVKSLSKGVVRIHSIIDGDKPHAQFREADLRIKPDFQIVAPERDISLTITILTSPASISASIS